MQTKLDYPRKNQDPRQKAAYYMMQENGPGAYELHGTTRSGKSLAVAVESVNRGEKIAVITPTNKIKENTFDEKKVREHSDKKDLSVVSLPPNKDCFYNQEMIKDFPGLVILPYLPLTEKCCKYDSDRKRNEASLCEFWGECPVTALVRGDQDISVLTYPKLVALSLSAMTAESAGRMNLATEILEKLHSCTNHQMDEFHMPQRGRKCTQTVQTSSKKRPVTLIDLNRYSHIEDFKYLGLYLRSFAAILSDPCTQEAINEVESEVQKPDAWKKHLRKIVHNKYRVASNEEGEPIPLDDPEVLMGAYSEIIELAKEHEDFGFDGNDILELHRIMTITASRNIIVHAEKNRSIKINLVADDILYRKMIQRYTKAINLKRSRLIFTSATLGSTNLRDYLPPGASLKKILHGHKGDPMHTNEKMFILADHKKYSAMGRASIAENMDDIVSSIIQVLDLEGDYRCYVVTRSAQLAKQIEKKLLLAGRWMVLVDYYRSDNTIGVEMSQRVCIAVGLAESPANSFDAITQSAKESRAMRIEAVLADTFQAWSRNKDPKGKDVSIVYALGCNFKQCTDVVSWGSKWNLEFLNEDLTEYEVTRENDITKPNIIACKDVEDMLRKAGELRNFSSQTSKMQKIPFTILKGENSHFCNYSKEITMNNQDAEYLLGQNVIIKNYILVGKYEFLLRITHNREKFLEGDYQGGWFTNHAQLSDSLIKSHEGGKGVIGVYPIAEDGTVSWICFDVDGHPKVEKQIADLNKWYGKEIGKIQKWYHAAIGVEGITHEIEAEEMEWRSRVFNEMNAKMQDLKDLKNMDEEACFAAAEAQLEKLTSFLDAQHIPYKLEASGGAHCYHVWLFLKPVHAKVARAFGELINKRSGANVAEINPKQDKAGGQNGVKLPFANYGYLKPSMGAKRLKKSQLMDKGVFVDDIGEIEIQELDISNFIFEKPIVTDAKKQKKETTFKTKESFEASGVRPFFEWARTQQLEGYQGDKCRVALFREYYANGLTDPEELARLFEHQNDYDFDESLRQVKSLMKKEFGPWKHETVEKEFGDIMDCYNRGVDFHYEEYVFDHAPGQDKE